MSKINKMTLFSFKFKWKYTAFLHQHFWLLLFVLLPWLQRLLAWWLVVWLLSRAKAAVGIPTGPRNCATIKAKQPVLLTSSSCCWLIQRENVSFQSSCFLQPMAAWAPCFQGINLNMGGTIMKWTDDIKSMKTIQQDHTTNFFFFFEKNGSSETFVEHMLFAQRSHIPWTHDWDYVLHLFCQLWPIMISPTQMFRLMYLCLAAVSALYNNGLYWNSV